MVMKACIITATRAEYGLLKPLIDIINESIEYQLQLLVTGTHLSAEFGMTWKNIEADGYRIDAKVEMLLSSDTPVGVSKSLGLMCTGFADAFQTLQPDFIIILGDRYEMVGVATVANLFNIPIVHIHGGEITQGALDDNFRHAITKLSHLHFASTAEYRQRIIQLGETPDRVFEVGAIGIDNIRNMDLLGRHDLAESIDLDLSKPYFLVT
ncbi:MAG: UDP-N-acetylglucosamine 2-epimerase, partial [Psychrobacillus sp.]